MNSTLTQTATVRVNARKTVTFILNHDVVVKAMNFAMRATKGCSIDSAVQHIAAQWLVYRVLNRRVKGIPNGVAQDVARQFVEECYVEL